MWTSFFMRIYTYNNLIYSMKNFCICTLTDGRELRDEFLKYTVKTFMDNWKGDSFEWFVLVNAPSDKIKEVINSIQIEYSQISWHIHYSEINLGPGGGINRLNELSKGYEYSLFLEGDWVTLPNYISGFSDDWINNSIKLLEEHPHIDQVQFRRYLNDADDRTYGFSEWIQRDNIEQSIDNGDKFYVLKNREYVNTPTLRRMSSYYNKGIFPLDEFWDENGNPTEVKGNPNWGMAEINASQKPLTGAWLEFGNFVHYENWPYQDRWQEWIDKKHGCREDLSGMNSCKYGFALPMPQYCATCSNNESILDIEIHNRRFLDQYVDEWYNQDLTNFDLIELAKRLTENPTVDTASIFNSIDDSRTFTHYYTRETKHNSQI